MIRSTLYIFILMLGFTSCNSRQVTQDITQDLKATLTKTKDSISYNYTFINKESKNSVRTDSTSDTTQISISFPQFKDESLNRLVDSILSKSDNPDEEVNSITEVATNFIKNYDSFIKHEGKYPRAWFSTINFKIIRQTDDLICFEENYSNYTGGAHGIEGTNFYNYSLEKKRNLLLSDIIMDGSLEKFTAAAERIFREKEKLAPDASLMNDYFFENGKFTLNNNFSLTKKEILFLYNPYEIRAYVYGQTKLAVPYSAIADYIQPKYLPNSTY